MLQGYLMTVSCQSLSFKGAELLAYYLLQLPIPDVGLIEDML